MNPDQLPEHVLLGSEVVVRRTDGDPRLLGDVGETRPVEPIPLEDPCGGLEQSRPCQLTLAIPPHRFVRRANSGRRRPDLRPLVCCVRSGAECRDAPDGAEPHVLLGIDESGHFRQLGEEEFETAARAPANARGRRRPTWIGGTMEQQRKTMRRLVLALGDSGCLRRRHAGTRSTGRRASAWRWHRVGHRRRPRQRARHRGDGRRPHDRVRLGAVRRTRSRKFLVTNEQYADVPERGGERVRPVPALPPVPADGRRATRRERHRPDRRAPGTTRTRPSRAGSAGRSTT